MTQDEAWTPTAAVAHRVRELRERRGFTAQRLADLMVEQGISWQRSTVAKLENGNRESVSLQEWLALAVVLSVSPLHLLVPPWPSPGWERPAGERNDPNDEAEYLVTPTRSEPMHRIRRFVRGEDPLSRMDRRAFYSEIPPQEFDPLLVRESRDE
jgi:transcriptional regulator with XRE-family HTH domain